MVAGLYYQSVRKGGGLLFKPKVLSWCTKTCVKDYASPGKNLYCRMYIVGNATFYNTFVTINMRLIGTEKSALTRGVCRTTADGYYLSFRKDGGLLFKPEDFSLYTKAGVKDCASS